MSVESIEKPQILVVDDSKMIRRAVIKMLGDDYSVHEAVDGMDGWQQLQRNDAISVVFSDMEMPNMNGIELLDNIRNSEDDRLSSLPVIMITGVSDTENAKRRVFDAGATDFIAKPFESIDLLSRARSYARLNRKVVELKKKSSHDELTGLSSIASFEEQGGKALSFAVRHKLQLTVVSFEIESFHDIYLAYGKSVAQQIIVAVAKRLHDEMRTEDVAARTGVTKYAVLLPLTSDSSAGVVVSRICTSINNLVFNTGSEKIHISIAAGYSSVGEKKQFDFMGMMQQADTALHIALESTTGQKMVAYQAQEEEDCKPELKDDDIRIAIHHILNSTYTQIPEHMLQAVAEKLAPFLDYVANRSDTAKTSTGNP